MIHIEGEICINRPVEEVFEVVADERNEPRYNPRLLWVEKISSGAIGRGTRFRAATKTMGRPVEITIEFIDYERPQRLASLTHLPTMEIQGHLSFEPVPEGTRMRWSWELQPRGVLGLLRPLIARMGQASGGNHLGGSQAVPGSTGGISIFPTGRGRLRSSVIWTSQHPCRPVYIRHPQRAVEGKNRCLGSLSDTKKLRLGTRPRCLSKAGRSSCRGQVARSQTAQRTSRS
jgi:uncharacterized protein YndB with AHSA1/START domain